MKLAALAATKCCLIMQAAAWRLKLETVQSGLPSILRNACDQIFAHLADSLSSVHAASCSDLIGATPVSMGGTQPRSTGADAADHEHDCHGPSQATAGPPCNIDGGAAELQEVTEEAWGGPLCSTHESISVKHNLVCGSQTLRGDGSPLMVSGTAAHTYAAVQPVFQDNETVEGCGVTDKRVPVTGSPDNTVASKRCREDSTDIGSLDLCVAGEEGLPECKRVRAEADDGEDHRDSSIENGDGGNTEHSLRGAGGAGDGEAATAQHGRSSVGTLAEMLTLLKRPDASLDMNY
jgi:hypothetical protein